MSQYYLMFDLNIKVDHIEDIYFSEVNTKYISSNVLKISLITRVCSTNEIIDIFSIQDEIFLIFTKKSKFSFFSFSVKGKSLTD